MTKSAIKCAKTLAYNLQYLRHSLGKTQDGIAKTSGLSPRLYQKLESGDSNPTIDSLDRLAMTFQVTVSDLLRLNLVRLRQTEEVFSRKFKSEFEKADIGVGIRTLNGVVLWANLRADELLGNKYAIGNVDLMKTLPSAAKGILKSQLECERQGIVRPYLNFAPGEDGELTFLRYYPCLIYPEKGTAPLYCVVYITDMASDCERNYYQFTSLILKTVS